jgi:hypothetical protein
MNSNPFDPPSYAWRVITTLVDGETREVYAETQHGAEQIVKILADVAPQGTLFTIEQIED